MSTIKDLTTLATVPTTYVVPVSSATTPETYGKATLQTLLALGETTVWLGVEGAAYAGSDLKLSWGTYNAANVLQVGSGITIDQAGTRFLLKKGYYYVNASSSLAYVAGSASLLTLSWYLGGAQVALTRGLTGPASGAAPPEVPHVVAQGLIYASSDDVALELYVASTTNPTTIACANVIMHISRKTTE